MLDVDRGPSWAGRLLQAQVLRPGTPVPEVADVIEVRCGDVTRCPVPLDIDDGPWVVLRIADPAARNGTRGPPEHPANNYAVAYTSPWFLEP